MSRQKYKLYTCWNDSGDHAAVFEILTVEVITVNSTFAKMASNTVERICAIEDDIFNEFLLKCKILFRGLRSCFNIFCRIYICAIFKVLLSLAEATGSCTYFKTS